ncbi:hypothetical protein T459_14200 [Capsicum annuum]|uniref:Uncharacterized protein n=1 Tax=Capsicum annuum TaxID=4072 RepID=A0A2G2ZGY5_CAPAN|nr:hypothetical protein T459_14200 [Capsicum annuum]
MEASASAYSGEITNIANRDNHLLETVDMTDKVMSINSPSLTNSNQERNTTSTTLVQPKITLISNGKSTQPKGTPNLRLSTSSSQSNTDLLGEASAQRKNDLSLHHNGGPTNRDNGPRPILDGSNYQGRYRPHSAEKKKRKAQLQEANQKKMIERVEQKMAAVARDRAWVERLAGKTEEA